MALVQHDLFRLGNGGVHRHGHDVRPRRRDSAHRHLVQGHDAAQDRPFVLVQGPLPPSNAGQGLELGSADGGGTFLPRGDQSSIECQGDDDRFQNPDEPSENMGCHRSQGRPERGTQGLGENLGEEEDAQGQARREGGHPGGPQDLEGQSSSHGRTEGVCDGVQRQDGGNGLVDTPLHAVEVLPDPRPGLSQDVHISMGHREENGLQDGAEEGSAQRNPEDQKELGEHGRTSAADRPRTGGSFLLEAEHGPGKSRPSRGRNDPAG